MAVNQALPEVSGRYVTTEDGVPIAAFEAGNPDGPCIIFMHGFGYSHAAFLLQFSGELSKHYRLIGFDMRGHGNSGKPRDRSAYATPSAWARDLEAVRTHFSADDAVVVAWSFGSMVFMDWVRCYGIGQFRGFVSVGSNGAMIQADEEGRRQRAAAVTRIQSKAPNFAAELTESKAALSHNVHRSIPDALCEMMIVTNMRLSLYATRIMVELVHDNLDLIPALTCPTQFILGEHDGANSQAGLQELATNLPNGSLRMMQGVGHSPFLEDPMVFDGLINTFMSELV